MLHLFLEGHGWQYCTHFADGSIETRYLPNAVLWNLIYLTPGPGVFFLAGQLGGSGRGGQKRVWG